MPAAAEASRRSGRSKRCRQKRALCLCASAPRPRNSSHVCDASCSLSSASRRRKKIPLRSYSPRASLTVLRRHHARPAPRRRLRQRECAAPGRTESRYQETGPASEAGPAIEAGTQRCADLPARLSSAFTCAHTRVARASTDQGRCVPLDYPAHTHPGRGALGNVTNGAKPKQQQQQQPVKQRRALGDISNKTAPTTSAKAWAKNDEGLPPVEYLHESDPVPLASFDFSGGAHPGEVAADVLEHRAPTFGARGYLSAACLSPAVYEEVPNPSPWAAGSPFEQGPFNRDGPPSPSGPEAAPLGRKVGRCLLPMRPSTTTPPHVALLVCSER